MWLTQTSFSKIARHSLMEKKNTSLANKMKKTYYSNDRNKPSYGRLDIFVKICFQNNK